MYRLILIESESKWSFGPIPLLDLKNQIQLDIESRTRPVPLEVRDCPA
jgi:hypothetical protein